MKTDNYQHYKRIICAFCLCAASVSGVYALDAGTGVESRCAKGPYPVKFGRNPQGFPQNTWNQDDCCTTACCILNPSSTDAASECSLDCEHYG